MSALGVPLHRETDPGPGSSLHAHHLFSEPYRAGRGQTPVPRPKAKQPETTAQLWVSLGHIRGTDLLSSGSQRSPAQRVPNLGGAATGYTRGALRGLKSPSVRRAAQRPPRPRGGVGQTHGASGDQGAAHPAPPSPPVGLRGWWVKGGPTHSGRATARRTPSAPSVPCARARSPQVPRRLTQCRRLRRAQRPSWRNSSGAGGGGMARLGEGKSARESRRQRETRGGRKRACAPPPASGEAEPQQ